VYLPCYFYLVGRVTFEGVIYCGPRGGLALLMRSICHTLHPAPLSPPRSMTATNVQSSIIFVTMQTDSFFSSFLSSTSNFQHGSYSNLYIPHIMKFFYVPRIVVNFVTRYMSQIKFSSL